jgi:hypothetical protein
MAEQKIIISIQVNERESKNTNKALKITKDNFDKLTAAEQKAIIADKQLSLAAKQLDKDLTAKAAAANAAAAATDNMRATSGLNNAIIMETSRLASDASFGFTAIANNLSQLVNLVQLNAKATGSFAGALKGLFTAQAGLLIGIQLLITFGDDLYKGFIRLVKGSQLIKETMSDAGSTVESTAGNFEMYIRTLQDSNKSQEEQAEAIHLLNEEFPEYVKSLEDAELTLKDVANQTKEATRVTDLYRESIVRLAQSEAAKQKIQQLASEQVQITIDADLRLKELNSTEREAIELQQKLNKLQEKSNIIQNDKKGFRVSERALQRENELIMRQFTMRERKIMQTIFARDKDIASRNEDMDSLMKFVDLEIELNEKGAGSRAKRNAAYKAGDLDFEKERQQSRERELKSIIKNEKAILLIESGGIKERARIKQKEFVEDEKRRLDAFKRRTKDQNAIIEATRLSEEAIRNSETELNKYIIRINDETNTKLLQMDNDFAKERYDNKVKNDAEFAELELLEETAHIGNEGRRARKLFDLDTEQLEQKKRRLQAEMAFNSTFMMGLASSTQTQIQLQEELTQVEQDLSMKRIKIAEAEAFAKREGLRVTGDALGAFAELAGKSTGEGKAMAIASTLISTYQTAQSAFESQFKPIALADSPIRGALAAAAAIARGLAQVKQIQSVKVPGGKSGGAGRGSVSIQSPDFNVVGASQTSQLSEAIATQEAKPVKAFVVGKDISTQQELDRNITNTASFG